MFKSAFYFLFFGASAVMVSLALRKYIVRFVLTIKKEFKCENNEVVNSQNFKSAFKANDSLSFQEDLDSIEKLMSIEAISPIDIFKVLESLYPNYIIDLQEFVQY